MQEFYHKFYSQFIEREFELLVFGHSGEPLIIFPTSGGKYYDCKDNGLIDSISPLIDEGKIKVYCPDGFDHESLLNKNLSPNERINNYLKYEGAILYEIINFAKYETEVERVKLAGCGLGGFHAANIAFKHQQLVDGLFLFSGKFDIKNYLDGYYNDDVYFNNPVDYIANCTDPWKYNHIKIFMGAGERDFALDDNKRFSWLLNAKGIPHKLEIWENADHHWYWWKQMFPKYLRKFFN